MKKILSVLLLFTVLFCALPLSTAAEGHVCDCPYTPIIYVRGKTELILDKDGKPEENGNYLLPRSDTLDVMDLAKKVVPLYCMNYLKNDFSEFAQLVYDVMDECYGDFRLDHNGEITNNSGMAWWYRWRDTDIFDNHRPDSAVTTPAEASYEVYKYCFHYDCRLDPLETADELKAYVDTVKEVTGHRTVKFLSRCEGNVILMAYFSKYGWEDVENVLFYNSVAHGTAVTDGFFTGYLALDAQGFDYFIDQTLEDTPLYELLKDVVDYLKATRQLDLLFDYFNKTLPRVGREILPEALRRSYATTPGYWAMVSPDRYEEARAFVFGGHEEEYAGLLEKLDRYHEQVGSRIDEMLLQMKADGVPVGFIAKYGFQLYPITGQDDQQSDTIITVRQQAPGATAAPIGTTFSAQYLEEQERLGNGAWLSADGCINAATCLFPDTTWFIRDLTHNDFPPAVDLLIYRFLYSNGEMTVFTDEDFPQFLQYSEEGCARLQGFLAPVTAEDTPNTVKPRSVIRVILNFYRHLFELFKWLAERIRTS